MKKNFFKESGRVGGKRRARNLSPGRRSEIAARAARARWKRPQSSPSLMPSVRFDVPALEEPAYLEEVLLDGTLADWSKIYEEIADRPFGRIAVALKQVLSSSRHYGVSPLWMGILKGVQGAS